MGAKGVNANGHSGGTDGHRLRQLGYDVGHAVMSDQRRLRLAQGCQVLDEIRKFLGRKPGLQSLRHQGKRAAPTLLNVSRGNRHQFPVCAHQLQTRVGRLFENALKFVSRLCFHDNGAITWRNRGRRHENRLHQVASSERITRGKQVRAGLGSAAIHRMAFRAGQPLLVGKKPGAARDVSLTGLRVLAISIQARSAGWSLGNT